MQIDDLQRTDGGELHGASGVCVVPFHSHSHSITWSITGTGSNPAQALRCSQLKGSRQTRLRRRSLALTLAAYTALPPLHTHTQKHTHLAPLPHARTSSPCQSSGQGIYPLSMGQGTDQHNKKLFQDGITFHQYNINNQFLKEFTGNLGTYGTEIINTFKLKVDFFDSSKIQFHRKQYDVTIHMNLLNI